MKMTFYRETLHRLSLTDDWQKLLDMDTLTYLSREKAESLCEQVTQALAVGEDTLRCAFCYVRHWGTMEFLVPDTPYFPALCVTYHDELFPRRSGMWLTVMEDVYARMEARHTK